MTSITHMLGWVSGHQWWTILLACGHNAVTSARGTWSLSNCLLESGCPVQIASGGENANNDG
jgi:hypothetical protein